MFRNFVFAFFVITSVVSVLKIRIRTQALNGGDVQIRVVMHVGDPETIKHFVKTAKTFNQGGPETLLASQIVEQDIAATSRAPASERPATGL